MLITLFWSITIFAHAVYVVFSQGILTTAWLFELSCTGYVLPLIDVATTGDSVCCVSVPSLISHRLVAVATFICTPPHHAQISIHVHVHGS